MTRRAASALLGLLVLASVLGIVGVTRPAAAAAPGFVTILFGRTQWVSVTTLHDEPCTPLPHTVTLGQAHDALARRGLPATGVVIPSRTPERGIRCFANYTAHPGWDRLRAWAREGWRFISGGDHALLADATYEEKLDDTCGSRAVFRAHGLSAVGMYAYADNAWSVATQHDPVSRCFLFGRRYGAHWINERSTTGAPWFQWTESVSGGLCHDRSLPCSTIAGSAHSRYTSPVLLARLVAAEPNTWTTLQFYRFVDGAYHGSDRWTWDCRGSDWRRHYTSQGELYCYGDFLRVLDALRAKVRHDGVVATDPAHVARAWGRRLDVPTGRRHTRTRVACEPGPVGGTVTCTARVTDVDDGWPAAPEGRVRWRVDGGALSAARCTLVGPRPTTKCSVSLTRHRPSPAVRVVYPGSDRHRPSADGIG